MTNGLLIYGEIFAHFPIYQEALPHLWLSNCSNLNFLIYEENLIFFLSVLPLISWERNTEDLFFYKITNVWTLKLLVNNADVSYYNYLSCMIMYYHTEWKINYIILFIFIHSLFICRRWRGAGQCSRVSCSIPTATAVTAVESARPISG